MEEDVLTNRVDPEEYAVLEEKEVNDTMSERGSAESWK